MQNWTIKPESMFAVEAKFTVDMLKPSSQQQLYFQDVGL